jgi:4-hydroxy-3-polyprenylbenzoate decarboxylase
MTAIHYLQFIFERINLQRDIHFYTNTTIDTLDYSGTGLNTGSKVVLAAYGEKIRELAITVPDVLNNLQEFENAKLVMPGVVVLEAKKFSTYEAAANEIQMLNNQCSLFNMQLNTISLIIIADDANFVSEKLNNFLWVAFTRCNPSHDMYGVDSFTVNKHWGCNGPLIFDARIKPHHAPSVEKDPATEKKIERLFEQGGSLFGVL